MSGIACHHRLAPTGLDENVRAPKNRRCAQFALPGHATLCVHRPGEGGRRIKAGGLAERLPGVGGRDRELRAFGTLAALRAGQDSVCASVL